MLLYHVLSSVSTQKCRNLTSVVNRHTSRFHTQHRSLKPCFHQLRTPNTYTMLPAIITALLWATVLVHAKPLLPTSDIVPKTITHTNPHDSFFQLQPATKPFNQLIDDMPMQDLQSHTTMTTIPLPIIDSHEVLLQAHDIPNLHQTNPSTEHKELAVSTLR